MRKFTLITSVLALGLLINSCSRESVLEQVDKTAEMVSTASDYASVQNAFDDVFDLIEEEAQKEGDLNGFTSNQADDRTCAEVTISRTAPDIFPLTMTIDFTGGDCTLSDGRAVSGTITSVFTGRFREVGTSYTISLVDFILDGDTIRGTQQIVNNGLNADGQLSFTTTVTDGMLLFVDGSAISYESTRTRIWIEGMDTNFQTHGIEGIEDDVWEITGGASGLNREDNTYDVAVTTALRQEMDCRWLTEGILEIDTEVFDQTIIVDYGNGICDDKARVTLGLIQREITMK